MKQNIDLTQYYHLSDDIKAKLRKLGSHSGMTLTIGRMIELIREKKQIGIYTVGTNWCIQLFQLNENANDLFDCHWEHQGIELVDALLEALVFVLEGEHNE